MVLLFFFNERAKKWRKNLHNLLIIARWIVGEGGREILLNKKCFYKIEMRTFTKVQEWVISSDKN